MSEKRSEGSERILGGGRRGGEAYRSSSEKRDTSYAFVEGVQTHTGHKFDTSSTNVPKVKFSIHEDEIVFFKVELMFLSLKCWNVTDL